MSITEIYETVNNKAISYLNLNMKNANTIIKSIKTVKSKNGQGNNITYLKRRFVPQPERFSLLYKHTVLQDERLDNLSNQYYNDPEQYWKICDANEVLQPDELTWESGNKIQIPPLK